MTTTGIESSAAFATHSATAPPTSPKGTGGKDAETSVNDLANQDVFLKLLVAQMQNQNPLSPSDPIQFVSQLAQFSALEQTIAMKGRLDDIYGALTTTPATKAP
jgi:flagellar basal-body rod modification protein FlgD